MFDCNGFRVWRDQLFPTCYSQGEKREILSISYSKKLAGGIENFSRICDENLSDTIWKEDMDGQSRDIFWMNIIERS